MEIASIFFPWGMFKQRNRKIWYLAWQKTETVGERWTTLSQTAGARVEVRSHCCVTPQIWAGRAEGCCGAKVWVGQGWDQGLDLGESQKTGENEREAHMEWCLGEGMGKRNGVRQMGRRKAVAHRDRLSSTHSMRIASLFKDRIGLRCLKWGKTVVQGMWPQGQAGNHRRVESYTVHPREGSVAYLCVPLRSAAMDDGSDPLTFRIFQGILSAQQKKFSSRKTTQ